mmetsp:Transcript_26434/g.57665  ORF Transcript_26434/g.57665 Transcript_26434/m.57665 type:complete len:258 (+) Transcript_26434:93-866(+)
MVGVGGKVAIAAAGAVALVAISWPVAVWFAVRDLEKPKYKVLKTLVTGRKDWLGRQYDVQLRQYNPYLVSEVEVQHENMREAMSAGFRQVARFIFGDNRPPGCSDQAATSKRKGDGEHIAMTAPVRVELSGTASSGPGSSIAMTSPVVTQVLGGDKYKLSFMMPSDYTADSLPVPNNKNIKIKEVPGHTAVAIGFSGNLPSRGKVDSYTAQLMGIIEATGLVQAGPATLLQYHPPFAPRWMRLNEVLVPVQAPAAAT